MDKTELYQLCLDYCTERVEAANQAIKEAQESANNETKSTAGDKHDTARAMAQLEVETHSRNLAEANKLMDVVEKIDPSNSNDTIALGAAVETSNGNFYISIPAGKISEEWFAISLASPIGQAIKGLKAGDSASFNGREISINNIF